MKKIMLSLKLKSMSRDWINWKEKDKNDVIE